jgi:dTDP-4-amino-4,6-dideoxygalactose transaminase
LGELVEIPTAGAGARPAWHLYVVRHPEAVRLEGALAQAGVQARGYYRTPVHRQPAMARWAVGVDLPVTDELARSNLALPMSPVLGVEQAQQVTAALAAELGVEPAGVSVGAGGGAGRA